MEKKVILGIVILAILGLGIYIFIDQTSSSKSSSSYQENSEQTGYSITKSDDNLYPLGQGSNIWDEALSPFQGEDKKSYLEIVSDLKSGKINFVWEVWALRSNCPKDYTPSQCDGTILAYIEANYESPDREKIKDLYLSYFKYESDIRQMQTPEGISFEDRYELIKDKRRKMLGDEKSELIFGMEEAQVNFMEGAQNFIQSSKNMRPDERVKKYEELRKKTYGSYYDNVMNREDKFNHYETEILLRENELKGLSAEEKEKKLNTLEIKYFGKEKAALISKARSDQQKEEKILADLSKQEAELLNKYPNMSDKERDSKIQELRVKALGSEEAEAYTRRLKFEKETEGNL
ncbi:lipase secretion chaperone [Leptospira sp. GIMC2001]|uniref:lipase secretion chaperone n=1 Tax=Leptospira sp. GIMC2001 TaxID=1513297 RepID=UPI00234A0759|nr:lipase secretion chaperone [Leptospira sp. GIMC2001]WCL48593.1 lipase secretion chaperone [Leptospira sp. GIMC2001]